MMAKSDSRFGPHDESGIIVDWLIKLIVVIGVFGIVAVEAVAVLIARYNAVEGASAAVTQAALGLRTNEMAGDPRALANAAAEQRGCKLISLHRNLETKMVFVTVEREARTFFIQDLGPLQRFTRVRATEDASYESR